MLKALLKIALLAICLLPTLSACSGDEPKTPEDNLPAETKKFVGIWEKGSGYNTTTLELFANGKCLLNGAKGEWAYDRNTKFLSTTSGIQATVTLSTDNAWTGYSPSGEEYNFKKQNVTAHVVNNYISASTLVKAIYADSKLTEEELAYKMAKEWDTDDDVTVTAANFELYLKKEHSYYGLSCAYSYTYVYDGRERESGFSFRIAEGNILEATQTSNGFRFKFSDTLHDKTYEGTINPFK